MHDQGLRGDRRSSKWLLIVTLGIAGFLTLSFAFYLYKKQTLPSQARDANASPNVITNPTSVLTVPTIPKPAYLSVITPQPFFLPVVRIAGDAGTDFTAQNGSGVWGTDVRQHYTNDQAWNADQSLIALQNSDSSSSLVFLDGNSYQPKYVKCANYQNYDDRWHPSLSHANERINVRHDSAILEWFDVVRCAQTRVWNLPFISSNDLGRTPSLDGRFIALSDGTNGYIVDMDPPTNPLPTYCTGSLTGCIGPRFNVVTNCGRTTCNFSHFDMVTGQHVVAHYSGTSLGGDYNRVFDIDPNTLAMTPHVYPATKSECPDPNNSNQLPNPADGWIWDLGHEDMALNPFDNNNEVVIGQRRSWCTSLGGVTLAQVVMARISDGAVFSLTDPSNEAHSYHISTVNWNRPGWAYVSFWPDSGTRFDDEIMAVRLDSTPTKPIVERFAHDHTDTSNCYRCEAHPVPSRDGLRILFASSWSVNCGTACGSQTNPQAFIVDARPPNSPAPTPHNNTSTAVN